MERDVVEVGMEASASSVCESPGSPRVCAGPAPLGPAGRRAEAGWENERWSGSGSERERACVFFSSLNALTCGVVARDRRRRHGGSIQGPAVASSQSAGVNSGQP